MPTLKKYRVAHPLKTEFMSFSFQEDDAVIKGPGSSAIHAQSGKQYDYAELLQDLATRIIPENLFNEVRNLVRTGQLDVTKVWEPEPLLSPISQLAGAPEWQDFLRAAFADKPEAAVNAPCPCHNLHRGFASTDPTTVDTSNNGRNGVEMRNLATFLYRSGKTANQILEALPQLLLSPIADTNNANPQQLLFVDLVNSAQIVEHLDALEASSGNTEFLKLKNTRGQTLFHAIAQSPSFREDYVRIDALSWMLERRPEIINEPDRFGWTPLDRLMAFSNGNVDSPLGRLLLSAGARLSRQIAPGFNLAATIETRKFNNIPKLQLKKSSLTP